MENTIKVRFRGSEEGGERWKIQCGSRTGLSGEGEMVKDAN